MPKVGGVQRTERPGYADMSRSSSSGNTSSQIPDAASDRSVQAVSSAATGLASRKLFTSLGTVATAVVMRRLSAAAGGAV